MFRLRRKRLSLSSPSCFFEWLHRVGDSCSRDYSDLIQPVGRRVVLLKGSGAGCSGSLRVSLGECQMQRSD